VQDAAERHSETIPSIWQEVRDLCGELSLRVGFRETCDVYHFTSFQLSEPRRKQNRKTRIPAAHFSDQFHACHPGHRTLPKDRKVKTRRREPAGLFLFRPVVRPPATGNAPSRTFRLTDEFMTSLDAWAASQADKPSRSEAIRRLVELALKAERLK